MILFIYPLLLLLSLLLFHFILPVLAQPPPFVRISLLWNVGCIINPRPGNDRRFGHLDRIHHFLGPSMRIKQGFQIKQIKQIKQFSTHHSASFQVGWLLFLHMQNICLQLEEGKYMLCCTFAGIDVDFNLFLCLVFQLPKAQLQRYWVTEQHIQLQNNYRFVLEREHDNLSPVIMRCWPREWRKWQLE